MDEESMTDSLFTTDGCRSTKGHSISQRSEVILPAAGMVQQYNMDRSHDSTCGQLLVRKH